MDTMGYLMYRQTSAGSRPWCALRRSSSHAVCLASRGLRLVGMGVGLPDADVNKVVDTNFPANTQGAQAEEESEDEDEENA